MNFSQTLVYTGLGTLTVFLPTAGEYFFEGKSQIPTLASGSGPSALQVVVKQNSSTIYTGPAGARGFKIEGIAGAFNDQIDIIFSSAAAADQPINAIKTTIAYGTGF